MNTIEINGESLTFEQVVEVAYGDTKVTLAETAIEKVERAAAAVDRLLERGEVAYGITTGFGALKDKIIPLDQVETLQRNIVLSHAVGVGDPFDVPTTRAILLIRANTLARGYSGIRLETLRLLIDCLNKRVHPVIPKKGSLGASGGTSSHAAPRATAPNTITPSSCTHRCHAIEHPDSESGTSPLQHTLWGDACRWETRILFQM